MTDPAALPTVVVTGANRGIGLEFARQYRDDGWRVIAACRHPDRAVDLRALASGDAAGMVAVEQLDIAEADSVAAFARRWHGVPIDLLINNAGTMGPEPLLESVQRQFLGSIDYALWADILATNTLGTVRVTEALLDNVAASGHRRIVTISSSTGSIATGNRRALGYTTSKAALNKAMTLLAREVADLGVTVALLCPGHVSTRMGLGGASLEARDSVAGMRRIIDSLTPADAGTWRRYDGAVIPW